MSTMLLKRKKITEDEYARKLRRVAEVENMAMYKVMMGDAYNTAVKKNRGLRRKYGLDFMNK